MNSRKKSRMAPLGVQAILQTSVRINQSRALDESGTMTKQLVVVVQRITLMCFRARRGKQMSKVRIVAVRMRKLWIWTMIIVGLVY